MRTNWLGVGITNAVWQIARRGIIETKSVGFDRSADVVGVGRRINRANRTRIVPTHTATRISAWISGRIRAALRTVL